MRRTLPGAALCAALLIAFPGGTDAAAPGPTTAASPATGLTGNGRLLDPVGRLTTLGDFPTGAALSPDGRFLWVVDAGHGRDGVDVVDVTSGRVDQVLPLPGGYVGVAFAPDGRHAYVSGEPHGDQGELGPTKGGDGDVVHVYAVDPATGTATEQDPIGLPKFSDGMAQTDPISASSLSWPEGLAVSPDGHWLSVALDQADRLAIVNLGDRSVRTVKAGTYPHSVVIDRENRAYVSSQYDGTVARVDLPSGELAGTVDVGGTNSHPEGLALSADGATLYAAVASRDQIAVVDTAGLTLRRSISVAREPAVGTSPVAVAVSPDGRTLYAADAGEDAVAAIALTDRPASGPDVAAIHPRTVYRPRSPASIARYRTLAHAATTRERLTSARARYLTGRPVMACGGPSAAADRRWGARALRALRRRGRARARAMTRARRALPRVRACGRGDIAGLKAGTVIGRIPTAAYPTAVAVTPSGRLLWVAAKGLGAGPNPDYGFDHPADSDKAPYGSYVIDKLLGRAGLVEHPTDQTTRALTARVDQAVLPLSRASAPAATPLRPGGPIKHVFYVVRENRTYDQVFGTMPGGDGDPKLQLFDDNGVPGPTGGVTPNAHALARRFGLYDNFYEDSEVSVDGHLITSSGYAIDYVQDALHPNYSGRGRAGDFGIDPVTLPPNGFIFDAAARKGVSFANYGEVEGGILPTLAGTPGYEQRTAGYVPNYIPGVSCEVAATRPTAGGGPGAGCITDRGTRSDTAFAATDPQSRFDVFQAQLLRQIATGTVPALNYLVLPNDHTAGTNPGALTPKALIADNDLGLGQIVDLISHSAIWKDSAIYVVEDDSQDGADHVDAHRSVAFVISPYSKRGKVIHTRYDQLSVLRSMEIQLGLDPLSLQDGLAAPMWDAFIDGDEKPDFAPYDAIAPSTDLDMVNGDKAPDARLSRALPFEKLDAVPQAVLDRILWHSVYGQGAKPPPPGPGASPAEHDRAIGALRAYREGENVRAWLAGRPDADG